MSELTNNKTKSGDIRWQLLATVSAAALSICATSQAASSQDEDRPTVWIELGGQLEQTNTSVEAFAPPFITEHLNDPHNAVSPLSAERFPRFSFGGEGSVVFQPRGSDWAFTAAIRYSRSNAGKKLHQQTSTQFKEHKYAFVAYQPVTRWGEANTSNRESHVVVDFSVGKDVGLGLLGHSSSSNIAFGVRYAQFSSTADTVFRSFPDPYYPTNIGSFFKLHHHSYYAHMNLSHSFRGIGPSVAWTGSTLLAGNAETNELAFDWAANASLLFGRQSVSGSHQSKGTYFRNGPVSSYNTSVHVNRSHSVIVPNVGAKAGLSFQHGPARVNFGYRADFFFGAIDGGIDTRKTYNRNFYGPFATISIGLGG